jgi:hypothetical protein
MKTKRNKKDDIMNTKSFLILACALTIGMSSAFAADKVSDPLNESYNIIGESLCKRSIEEKQKQPAYKSLKLVGTKLDGICLMTAKTALSECTVRNAELFKAYLSSKDKERVSRMMKASFQYCAAYADLPSNEIVNMVLDDAVASGISIDAAVNKTIAAARK